jgi:hypothetical protein
MVYFLSRESRMDWLLFTYWLPPEPSRKRVSVWRHLKKAGALLEGAGWLLPKTDPLLGNLAGLVRTVEEMGGTANLYIVSHFTKDQEERTVARFQQERQKEYSDIVAECQKALKHVEWEIERREFNFEEVEELEGDLEKIKRWYADVKQRDFWETPVKGQVEESIGKVEESLAAFVQKTYEETAGRSGESESEH